MAADETIPTAYVPGPLTPAELVDVLSTSVQVLHSDRGHDVFTYFDILIQDHLRALSPEACYQVARAVLKHLTGIGALETQEPIRALHRWHHRNRSTSGSVMTLERAFTETLKAFQGGLLDRAAAVSESHAPQSV
ncbi:hypothetical protein [Actinospica robiniae]|uniref:hypothetical protein n=1 Tax=Actinospica robiniae TaxID=304901 RepID=UPI0003FAC6C7|nr:hypothetical protein [Actinospica robiniae]